MEKEMLYQEVDRIANEFPESLAEMKTALEEFELQYRRKLALLVDNFFIIAILRKEFINSASYRAKNNAALTLKLLTQPVEGKNSNMPHLKHLHPMSRSAHFRTLCKKGLAKKLGNGSYCISDGGWQVLERAYKISKMAPPDDADYKAYINIIGKRK